MIVIDCEARDEKERGVLLPHVVEHGGVVLTEGWDDADVPRTERGVRHFLCREGQALV